MQMLLFACSIHVYVLDILRLEALSLASFLHTYLASRRDQQIDMCHLRLQAVTSKG